MRRALFSGTFDPCTNTHVWLVSRSLALDLFDEIIVGVTNDPATKTFFTLDERVQMYRENAEAVNNRRIEVVAIDEEPPVRAARRLGCSFLLRGIRSAQEYEAEVVLQRANHDLEPMIQTIFLIPDAEYTDISASIVRGLIGKPGWTEAVKRYVPVATWEALVRKFGRPGVGE